MALRSAPRQIAALTAPFCTGCIHASKPFIAESMSNISPRPLPCGLCSFPFVTCEMATVDVSDALGKVRCTTGHHNEAHPRHNYSSLRHKTQAI